MRQTVLLYRTFQRADCRTEHKITVYCNMVDIYREIIFYTIRNFVLASRVCDAGLHLCTDLFLQVLNSGGRVGRSSYQEGPIQNRNFNARETLLGEKMSLKRKKLNLFEGLSFDQWIYYRQDCYPDVSDRNLS